MLFIEIYSAQILHCHSPVWVHSAQSKTWSSFLSSFDEWAQNSNFITTTGSWLDDPLDFTFNSFGVWAEIKCTIVLQLRFDATKLVSFGGHFGSFSLAKYSARLTRPRLMTALYFFYLIFIFLNSLVCVTQPKQPIKRQQVRDKSLLS